MGEVTSVARATSKFESLRSTIPRSVVKQWGLHEGDKIEWIWKVVDGELSLIVRRVDIEYPRQKAERVYKEYQHLNKGVKKVAKAAKREAVTKK